MHELLVTLSFSLPALITALCFSMVAPPLGATFSLRNEILLGIALPPIGSAVIAASLLAGLPPDATLVQYLLVALSLFAVMMGLPLSVSKKRLSMRRRELILAALFCIGNTLTLLFMSLSPQVEGHFKNILQGELLAVSPLECGATALCAIILACGAWRFRGSAYAYSLDEEGLRIKDRSYKKINAIYRGVATLVITGGIILIGPLLTTALLVLPAFILERSITGTDRFMLLTGITAFVGTAIGFMASIVTDLPPAPVAIIGIGFVAVSASRLFRSRSIS